MWIYVLLGLLGYPVMRRVLREEEPLTAFSTGMALYLVLFLTLVNGLGRHIQVGHSVWWSAGFLAVASFASLALPAPERRLVKLARSVWVWFLGCLVFAGLFVTVSQNLNPDDDHWIHCPLQGLMANRTLPPAHPFFDDIQMNGHYGRDLLIASLSHLMGEKTFTVQIWVTSVAMVLAVAIAFLSLQRHTTRVGAAVLGTSLLLFGINVGGRAGLVDTYQNNNMLVAMYVVLLLYLYNQLWATPATQTRLLVARAGAAGLVLGNLAVVYETHFGILVAVLICGTLVRRLMLGKEKDIPPWSGALALVLSLLLAATQGGPMTKLAGRSAQDRQQLQSLSAGEMNQRQVVVMKFPKKELFKIQLGVGSYQRVSCAYMAFEFLSSLAPYEGDTPYAAIWSWKVLQMHWLATLLVPLSLLVCFRYRSWIGLSYLAFGLVAYLVPSLVDFGPIYEFEYFRWEFAAGFGFATGLGIALGELGGRLRYPRATWSVIGVLTFLAVFPFFNIFLPRVNDQWRQHGYRPGLLSPMQAEPWLAIQEEPLRFSHYDYQAAEFLRTRVRQGDTALMNFPTRVAQDIHCESTFTGVCPVRMVGHSLPASTEVVGTAPYHMSAPAKAFWTLLEPVQLAVLGVDWVYLRPSTEKDKESGEMVPRTLGLDIHPQARLVLEETPGLELVGSFPVQNPESFLYRVELDPVKPVRGEGTLPVRVTEEEALPAKMERGAVRTLSLGFENLGERAIPEGTLLECSFPKVDTPRERIYLRLPQKLDGGETISVRVPLVVPHEPGEHQLRIRLEEGGFLEAIDTSSLSKFSVD